MNILDHDSLTQFCCRSANALADCDTNARRLSVERAQYQFVVLQEIEPNPVNVRQRVIKKRREVGCVRYKVMFTFEQGAKLRTNL